MSSCCDATFNGSGHPTDKTSKRFKEGPKDEKTGEPTQIEKTHKEIYDEDCSAWKTQWKADMKHTCYHAEVSKEETRIAQTDANGNIMEDKLDYPILHLYCHNECSNWRKIIGALIALWIGQGLFLTFLLTAMLDFGVTLYYVYLVVGGVVLIGLAGLVMAGHVEYRYNLVTKPAIGTAASDAKAKK